MTGENDPGYGKTATAQTVRKLAEDKLAGGDKPLKDMSASEMSTLIHELQIHQVELEMQNKELRKSQAETVRSRKAYQDLWELSPAGYLVVDAACRVAAVNRAGQGLFGKPEKALLNERFSTLVAPENQVPVHLMLEMALETGIAERQEVRIVKPDGAVHICLLEVCSLGGAPGREQIQAVLTDITRQKRAEDDLRRNEQAKTDILDSLVEHVVYQDSEMKILWANRAACESVQMKRKDLLGRYCHEIWADRRTPCEDCPVRKSHDTEQPQQVEKMTPDGRWWYIQGHQIQDHNGHVMCMTEITLDITDRKRAEEALLTAKDELEVRVEQRTADLVEVNEKFRQEIKERKRSEKKLYEAKSLLSNTFDAIQDMVVVIDKDFRVSMSNWKGHDFISEKDRRGHPYCYEVFMHRKKPCNPCHATKVFAGGETRQFEGTNPIDGKVRDIRVFPMLDDKGKVVAVIEHLRDISELKQAEQALRENEEKYRQLFENESDAVMIFDTETGQFEDANQATLDLFGYSREEFLILNVEDISAEKEKTRSNVKKIRGGGAFAKRVPLRYFKKKDSTVFSGEISAGRFTIGGRLKIVGAVRDISKRQRLLDELGRSEEFNRNLLENAPNPILVFAPDTSVKYVNPAFEKLSGYLSSEILGAKVPYPWWIEGLLSQIGKDFDTVFKTGILDLEQTFRKKNGDKFWVEISSKPVRKDGELIYYLSIWIDVTKRRQAREKLRGSEKKYRTLVDKIPIGVTLINRNMEVLTLNSQLQKWYPNIKIDKKPLCYQAFNDPPGEGVCTYCPTIKTLQDGQVHESLTETPAGDEIRHYRIVSSPIEDNEGKAVASIEMVEDVTDRMRMEKALQDSERRFRSIFENAPIGFYRTTPDGRILNANPALIHMLGYASFEELAAVNLETQDYHPEYSRRDFREHIEREGEITGMESFWKQPDGTSVYIRENARAIRGSDGKIVCYEGTIEDISDQKQAIDQIRILSQQLIKAQEDERQMISRELHDRVAQDLSTLLIGLNTIFKRQPNVIPEVQKKALAFSEILQGTIKAVRDLSYELRPPGLDDMGLIPALSMYCEEFGEKNGLKVDFQATGMSALRLDVNTEMNLYRLIQEALNNIHKHADASQATVKLVGTCPNIILRIEDDGKGFDVEERARTAGSEKRMGLRSMAERVNLIRGRMAIQSQPMKGTRIFIKFPFQEKKDD